MRRLRILTALAALIWLAVPVVSTAGEPSLQAVRVCADLPGVPVHRRANFSKTPTPPRRFERCWYQAPDQGASVPASVEIGPGMEVALDSVWRNRFRARHNRLLWHGRAFPGSIRGYHGSAPLYRAYRGVHGARGHGRRW